MTQSLPTDLPVRYQPYRAVLAFGLIFAVAYSAAADMSWWLGSPNLADLQELTRMGASGADQSWFQGFVVRAKKSLLMKVIATVAVAFALYGITQVAWLTLERRCIENIDHRFYAAVIGQTRLEFVVALAGRTRDMSHFVLAAGEPSGRSTDSLRSARIHAALTRHCSYGRAVLGRPTIFASSLLPTLGFLGTVYGISLAVAHLPNAMETGQSDAVYAGLYAAFDTTCLGLAGGIFVRALHEWSLGAWGRLEMVLIDRLGALTQPEFYAPGAELAERGEQQSSER